MASGGHPPPLLRRPDGRVEKVSFESGHLLGFDIGNTGLVDFRFTLAPDETLILYTDGFIEARDPASKTMFEVKRLQEALANPRGQQSLEAAADQAKAAVERFTGSQELQDDMTLLLLRRL